MDLSYKNSESAIFSVLGLPASGTTIIAHLLDSVEQTVCISEPFFSDYNNTIIDPFGRINAESDREFFNLLMRQGSSLGLGLVGTKEVGIISEGEACRLRRVLACRDLFAVVLVVFRNPITNINSVLAQPTKFPRAKFVHLVETYKWLLVLTLEDPKLRPLVYERFCNDPISELNRALSGVVTINGEPTLISSSRNIRGDRKAWSSSEVKTGRNRARVLTAKQVAHIEAELMPAYLKLLSHGGV